MNKVTKIFKSSLLGSIALMFFGILLFFQSEATIVTISYVIGAILIALGALAILKFIKAAQDDKSEQLEIVYGLVTIILGIVVIGHPDAIASLIPFAVGFIIIVNSATKLQYSLELKKNDNDLWKSTMILALITTLCGVVLILNPFEGAVFITKIIGIIILVYAVLDLTSTIVIKRTAKKIQAAIEENIVDAKIIEDKTKKKKEDK